jgi:probable rRNA maturation factor
MTIVLTDSRRIRRLNARFARKDRVTDVLAFPSTPPSRDVYLGDVVISLPRARRQARGRGVPLKHELALLIVHGTLHLLGHDHAGSRQRRRMWKIQAACLRRLGLDPERLEVPE